MYHPKVYSNGYDRYAVRDVVNGADDAATLTVAMTSKDMHVKLSIDPVMAEKELALRIFLSIEPTVEVVDDGRCVFCVNPTTVEAEHVGPGPQKIVDDAKALKEKLAPFFFLHAHVLENPAQHGESAFMSFLDPANDDTPDLTDWETSFLKKLLACDTNSVSAWNGVLPPDRRRAKTSDDGTYKVLTDREADEQARSVARSNVMEAMGDMSEDWVERYFNMDLAISDQLESFNGGRGKALNPVDGSEQFETVDETRYYIYQQS